MKHNMFQAVPLLILNKRSHLCIIETSQWLIDGGKNMLSQKFYAVTQHEGVVSITSWGNDDTPNVRCTWNSHLRITADERILAPIAGFTSVQGDVAKNDRIILTLGSREVEGFNNYQGTGFLVEGRAHFTDSGAEFEQMKAEFPFMNKLLEVTVESAKQLL